MWILSVMLAAILAIPPLVVVTVLAQPVAALLLSGDLVLAARLLPEPFDDAGSGAWTAAVVAAAVVLVVWARLYTPAILLSDDARPDGLRAAWRESRQKWRPVAWLYLQGGIMQAALAALLVGVSVVAPPGAAGGLLGVVLLFMLGRTLIRAWLTVAVRHCVLDGTGVRRAWTAAAEMLANRRGDAIAAWMGLAGAGVAVWLGGRLVSPILQDSALAYPRGSVYALGRETIQMLLAVPLEAFLIALALVTWTGFYKETERIPLEPGAQRTGDPPLLVRGLAVVAVLTLVANGGATLLDDAWARHRRAGLAKASRREIGPDTVVRATPGGEPADTHYEVAAELDGRALHWTTQIEYRNVTGESIERLPLNVYPAAYARPVRNIPLAADLIAADPFRTLGAQLESGDLTVDRVGHEGRHADFRMNGTVLTVELNEAVPAGQTVRVTVSLYMELPIFPERFGVWEDMTLLGNWIPTVAHSDGGDWRLYPFTGIGDPFLSDTADYEVAITTDDRTGIVGSGTLVSVEPAAGERRTWRFTAPASRDAAYAVAGGLRGRETEVDGVIVRSWYTPDDVSKGRLSLDASASASADFLTRFGALPHDEIETVVTPGFLGGMEYPGVVFVGGDIESLAALPEIAAIVRYADFEDALLRYVTAHEVAHQWWYAAVGNDPVREPWLDEAMAEMSVRLWLRATDGNERAWMMANLRTRVRPRPRALRAQAPSYGSNDAYVEDVYLGGSQVLIDLRNAVGAAAFDSAVKSYYESSTGTVASTEDFMAAVRTVAESQDLKRFLTYF